MKIILNSPQAMYSQVRIQIQIVSKNNTKQQEKLYQNFLLSNGESNG